MPKFKPAVLQQIGYELFEAAGCTPEDTRAVVDHLIESNLFGHDSHGAIRFYEYARAIREGRFQTRATPEIVSDKPCTAVVDANGALGQVGATFAINLAIEKARQYGTSTVTLRNTSHVGRAGAYPLLAARAGMMALAFVNAGRLGYQIAPFGGIDGRLTTNPIAFSAPRREAEPLLVDMTTSVVAEGKVRVAINKGVSVPEGWLIDGYGNPTTDPNDFRADPPGAILPMGGVVAHKGYGLSFVVELLGGALSGQGCAAGERTMVSNGVLFTVYNIEHFTEFNTYYDEIESLIRHVKSSRLAPGFTEILVPGEPEFRSAERVRAEGIALDDTTWGQICEEAREFGLDPSRWEARAIDN
jgi:hydroxycarboxylate dehydrogenase B